MFTGIVEAVVPVLEFTPVGEGAHLTLPAPDLPDWEVGIGQSISVSGACLTVSEVLTREPGMVFHLSRETLDRTWFGSISPGRAVNLERAMVLGERLDGHLVAGHVDGGGRLVEVTDVGDGGRVMGFEVDAGLERYLIEKGSVCLDGISLTVVEPRGTRFDVAVIPLTLEVTNLGRAEVGCPVNVEVDMVGKWIERLLPGR